jgi:hypothetical protein
MTPSTTTALIRDRAFAPLASDVPVGVSLPEYRCRRRKLARRPWIARALRVRWTNP